MSQKIELNDLEYAKSLHRELNGIDIDDLDDSDVIFVSEDKSNAIQNAKIENFKFQAGTSDYNGNKYYNDALKLEIDTENLADWTEVKMNSNIQMIFDNYKNAFFASLAKDKYQVTWEQFDDGSSFKIIEERRILISENNLIRPRIQLISIILHALIHLFLHKASNGKIKVNHHDNNFRKIMHYINDKMKTTVTICHNFTFAPEEDYSNHWWQCTGMCSNYQPFHGIVRSTIVPNECLKFWSSHHDKCTGSFFKIFEFYRKNDGKKLYLRSTNYMNPAPKSSVQPQKKNDKTKKLQVREQIDLTDEAVPTVKNLCEVIDLDESSYSENEVSMTPFVDFYNKFILDLNFKSLTQCVLCEQLFVSHQLNSHFDSCTGFQKKVELKFRN